MPRGRPKRLVVLSADDATTLQRWASRPTTAQALALRARIVLACSTGQADTVIARDARVNRLTVGRWRRRFLAKGVAGLLDEPRPGAPRTISDEHVEHVIRLTLETKPREQADPFRIALVDYQWVYDEPDKDAGVLSRISMERKFGADTMRIDFVKAEFSPDDEVVRTLGAHEAYVFRFREGCWQLAQQLR